LEYKEIVLYLCDMKETKKLYSRVTVTAKFQNGETYVLVGEGGEYEDDPKSFEMKVGPNKWLVAHNDGSTWGVYLAEDDEIIEYLQVISVFIEYNVQ